ncbi:peptidylprolyl isomerase [Pseudahrensia aquimaris]|uniref:Parvulin-like PPIase n=1 Tax=Pseudahrensia aquimaris TaxID=744461 RepID=A0ABW3FBH3_9HYPH
MPSILSPFSRLLAAGVVVVSLAGSAFAQEDKPVAKVGDRVITTSDLDEAVNRLGQQFSNVPEEQRRARILDALIDFSVLAAEAEKSGVADTDAVKKTLEYLRIQALHNAYFSDKIRPSVTEEQVKARYDEQVAAATPEQEVKARHILVKTEEEAKAIIAELDGGADFIELAKTKSTGPSGPQGGDLGFFGKGRMVPEFEQAAFAMKAGEYSKEPVKTQFGFHVLKVDEVRDVALPTFEQSKGQIEQLLLSEAYAAAVKSGRSSLGIEVLDESLKLPEEN